MGMKIVWDFCVFESLIEDVVVDVFEIVGMIKWFDVGKGYGFIVLDSGDGDILLYVICFRCDGF